MEGGWTSWSLKDSTSTTKKHCANYHIGFKKEIKTQTYDHIFRERAYIHIKDTELVMVQEWD